MKNAHITIAVCKLHIDFSCETLRLCYHVDIVLLPPYNGPLEGHMAMFLCFLSIYKFTSVKIHPHWFAQNKYKLTSNRADFLVSRLRSISFYLI